MAKIEVKAKKDLTHGDGSLSFKKGQTYTTVHTWYYSKGDFCSATDLIDEQGEVHRVGIWLKHFTVVRLIK